jgi:LmbE family N-acetylglucosaminyl deacetylase
MSGRKVLVVAAHPDDETLGCGATMARHAREGDAVEILILAEGATSRAASRDAAAFEAELERLRASGREAARIVGATAIHFAGLPDNRLDGLELLDVVKVVEAHGARVKPDVVYTHASTDLNVDHRVTHDATITAFRPLPGASGPAALHFFEVPSSTEWNFSPRAEAFRPNHFVDVSATLATKLAALDAYASEMRPWPHPRSREGAEALARWRGCTVGVDAAEAFVTGRTIVR